MCSVLSHSFKYKAENGSLQVKYPVFLPCRHIKRHGLQKHRNLAHVPVNYIKFPPVVQLHYAYTSSTSFRLLPC